MSCPVRCLVILFFVVCSLAFASGCTASGEEVASAGTIKVTVTILPQKEFVEAVGGEIVDVFVLVPPGANPHSYEPTSSDLAEVSESDVYITMGSGIEFELLWLDKIRELNPALTIIDSSEGVYLISENGEGGADPHIWLSPENVITITGNIRDALTALDPEHSEYYSDNAETYTGKLEELDKEISEVIDASGTRVIMVSHPAWTYFAYEYGLRQIAIQAEGKEPSPAGIKELIDEATLNNVKAIFISPEFSSSNARAIANEIGGTVVVVDPLAEDYVENMRKVSEAFSGDDAI